MWMVITGEINNLPTLTATQMLVDISILTHRLYKQTYSGIVFRLGGFAMSFCSRYKVLHLLKCDSTPLYHPPGFWQSNINVWVMNHIAQSHTTASYAIFYLVVSFLLASSSLSISEPSSSPEDGEQGEEGRCRGRWVGVVSGGWENKKYNTRSKSSEYFLS